ncbi:uncharacterized protein LOC119770559 [Culex quinquefasciatus]|uniref:uncharacterized protein LOC119770559 n=1 Tax=Culex quinquefasciatus TaxID=7176 RepID=UPI0018E2D055|nr:uncharacterized protein LOC119770559 [Culex quinquefasciatus]
MKPLKRKQAGSDAATPKVKLARMDQPPPLPTEVWELIFQNLNGYYLKLARQTCSSWNRIILGSTRLMGKFLLSLTSAHFANHRKHVRALLATGGYTQAVFHMYGIGNHKPRINWLVPLGLTLHTLSFETSGTQLLLAQILKETPNLKRLDIIMDNRNTIDVVPNFRLEKLEELSIRCFERPAKLIRFCRQICSRLTVLKVFGLPSSEGFEPEVIAFVLEVRKTLQELETGLSSAIVDALEAMDDLRLTRANLIGSSQHCLRLLRSQPNLVQLDISRGFGDLVVEDLDEILTLLPHLKTLAVRFKAYASQPSLSCQIPSIIETLCIKYGHLHMGSKFRLNINIRNRPKLRHLSLSSCNISRRNLRAI